MLGKVLIIFLIMGIAGSFVFGIGKSFILATIISFIFIFLFFCYLYLRELHFAKIGYKKVPNIMDVEIKDGKLYVRKDWKERKEKWK